LDVRAGDLPDYLFGIQPSTIQCDFENFRCAHSAQCRNYYVHWDIILCRQFLCHMA